MEKKKCPCSCGCDAAERREYHVSPDKEMTLAELPVGATATIVQIMPEARGRKKFADVGLVPGTELLMEAHAPFGGLIRVKVMETSMALHREDVKGVVVNEK